MGPTQALHPQLDVLWANFFQWLLPIALPLAGLGALVEGHVSRL